MREISPEIRINIRGKELEIFGKATASLRRVTLTVEPQVEIMRAWLFGRHL